MRSAAALAIAVVAAAPTHVGGHQTDEYLQATRLSIARDRVVVGLTLTPGASIAPHVFTTIDSDRDARISPNELETYALSVVRDLALTVDGRLSTLTLLRVDAASWDEMRDGVGAIRLEAVASVPALVRGGHSIAYANAHDPANSVYLVNALVPSDPAINIRGQRRDRLQHGIALDLDVGAASPAHEAIGLLVTAIALLVAVRRPKRA